MCGGLLGGFGEGRRRPIKAQRTRKGHALESCVVSKRAKAGYTDGLIDGFSSETRHPRSVYGPPCAAIRTQLVAATGVIGGRSLLCPGETGFREPNVAPNGGSDELGRLRPDYVKPGVG